MAFKYILILGTMIAAVACATASSPSPDSDASGAGGPTPTSAVAVASAPSPVPAQGQVGLDPDVNPPDLLNPQKVTRAIRYSSPRDGEEKVRVLEIVDVVPRDVIRAIDNPQFLKAAQASDQYAGADLIIGVSINGEHKAYSTAFLSSHEIVNDVVGGKPVAVTW